MYSTRYVMEHSSSSLRLSDGYSKHLPDCLSHLPSTSDKLDGDTDTCVGVLSHSDCTGDYSFLVRSEVQI